MVLILNYYANVISNKILIFFWVLVWLADINKGPKIMLIEKSINLYFFILLSD
jgi:hypothetical protein